MHSEYEAFHVAVEDAVEVLFADGFKGSVVEDAGVSEDDIEFPFFLFDLFIETVQILEVGHIHLNGSDVGSDLFDCGIKFGLRASSDVDVGAFADEVFRRGQADAAVAAGDECDFSVELTHDLLRTSLWIAMRVDGEEVSADSFGAVGVAAGSDGEVVAEGLHFAGCVGVVGAVGDGDAFVQAADGFFGAALFGEGLGGHLVSGDVGGVVLDEGGELGESDGGVALTEVFHGETVAREGVGRVELEDFVEGGDLVHELMVRVRGRGWQVGERLTTDLHR